MTRVHGFLLCVGALFVLQTPVLGAEGRVVQEVFHSAAIEGNLLGDTPDRGVAVYLPPSYDTSPNRRYPVFYLLHGYLMNHNDWVGTAGNFGGMFSIRSAIDRFMNEHPDRELIIVMPNGHNKYLGSWYANSPVTGNFEDFLTKELVPYIDATYRTMPQAAHRGMAGYSMGGAGAWRLAMRYPAIYGAMYSLSGGGPLVGTDWIVGESSWRVALALEDMEQYLKSDIGILAKVAAAAAYSPNPGRPPFFVDFPFELVGEELKRVDAVWEKWVACFDIVAMAHTYRENLRQLQGIRFGFGDGEAYLSEGRPVAQALGGLGIPYVYDIYGGDHITDLQGRAYTFLLPFMARALYGDLPVIESATMDLGLISPGQPVPDTNVVLSAPPEATGAFPQLALDAASLGVAAPVPMPHDGSGRYTLRLGNGPATTGAYRLYVSVVEPAPPPYRICQLFLTVWPAGDLQVVADGVADGWTTMTQLKATLDPQSTAQAYEGRSALAVQTNGLFRAFLNPAKPVKRLGYTALRFAFHPGDVGGTGSGEGLELSIAGRKVTLWPAKPGGVVVDMATKAWQVVEVPIHDLDPDLGMGGISFTGKLIGTFYLDDLRLVAAAPAPPPPATAVLEDYAAARPTRSSLDQNYPNPFNGGTVIRFALPQTGEVELALYNLAGQKVATLVQGAREAGTYTLLWDGQDDNGRQLASGVYLYRLQAGAGSETRRLLLLR